MLLKRPSIRIITISDMTIIHLPTTYLVQDEKKKVNYDKWKEGLLNNIGNQVTNVVIDSLDGDKAVASFEMTSRDYQDDGTILVQKFGGKWQLVKEFSGWKLSVPETKKLDQWIVIQVGHRDRHYFIPIYF